MNNFKNLCIHLTILLLLAGCTAKSSVSHMAPDITNQLSRNASPQDIAEHLITARNMASYSRALPLYFPDMSRKTAYQIQMLCLEADQKAEHALQGWKLGGTVLKTEEQTPDPVFGYSTDLQHYEPGQIISSEKFVNDSVEVEAEICFIIGSDLADPNISREAVIEAIDSVCGAIELISVRVWPISETDPDSKKLPHAIADNVSHGGAILGTTRLPLPEIDLAAESVTGRVNNVEKSTGYARYIMGGDAIAAIHWLARELPKHGQYLHAGDFILTGSLYDNPKIGKGERAEVSFSSLGRIAIELK